MTLDDTVKEEFSAFCPNCEKKVDFYYVGTQVYRKDNKIEKKIELYNCGKCSDTLGKASIRYYNILRAIKDGA